MVTCKVDLDNDNDLYIPDEEGGLVSTADTESASIESVDGEIIDATQANQAVEGHGKHTKCSNVLYSSKFWVTK
jgi:hypothetical protein